MSGTPTPKYGLPTQVGTDLVSGGDNALSALALALDALLAPDDQGLLASRPVSTPGTPGKAGRRYFATDDTTGGPEGTTYRDTGTSWVQERGYVPDASLTMAKFSALVQGAMFAPGDVKATLAAVVVGAEPLGWLLANGRSVLRSDWPVLFAALGGVASPYGLPDGTHFNLPDYCGAVLVGAGAGTHGLTTRALGASGGDETYKLTARESGVNPTGMTGDDAPDHYHGPAAHNGFILWQAGDAFGAGAGATPLGQYSGNTGGASTRHQHQLVGKIADDAHPNMQPWRAANVLIKT
jgi:microcystin-dependent protein